MTSPYEAPRLRLIEGNPLERSHMLIPRVPQLLGIREPGDLEA